jgi:UPF0489 domain
MYEEKKILSTPISNNSLNWDERKNHTIIVPSLIEGTLDDVQIGKETVIESDVDGKIVAGRWLEHFVFLKDAKVPTWIMDNHNHAFAFWHEALWKWWIQKWILLVHIDQHTDLATPVALPMKKDKIKKKNEGIFWDDYYFQTMGEVEKYTNTELTIADFIVPALAIGLIWETLMVTGEDMQTSRSYVWQMTNDEWRMTNEGKLIKKSTSVIARNEQSEWRGDPEACMDLPAGRQVVSQGSRWQRPATIIVDIDLDYFSQGFDESKTLETTKYWIEKADIITIATSPLFIDQQKALEYLRKLF